MGVVVSFKARRHGRASVVSPAAGAMPHKDGSPTKPRARRASDITKYISAGMRPARRQFDTACIGRPVSRDTAAVPPSASMAASTEVSEASGIDMTPDIYMVHVHGKNIHALCSQKLGILEPSPAMARKIINPRSMEGIATRLTALRMAIGPNQKQFAEATGYSSNTWNNWERLVTHISLEQASKLVDVHGVTLDWIYLGNLGGVRNDLLPKIQKHMEPAEQRVIEAMNDKKKKAA